jgi:integrase
MLGLMAGTGIRIGESINVKIGDIKLDSEPPVLEIRVTKFQKSMLVPLRPTKRHVRVTAIVREAILKRDFTHWSVKFQRVNPPDAGKPIGANDFFTTDLV